MQGAPSDISDMRDRFEDMERNLNRKAQHGNSSDKLESIEKDVDHLMGRGETSDVSGVPTMVKTNSIILMDYIFFECGCFVL